MKNFLTIFKIIYHFFAARNTRGFGVHSPFMYQFIQNVLGEKHYFYVFSEIESLRKRETNNTENIFITDYGTGSDRSSNISDIANNSLNSPKYGQLLFRIVRYFNFKDVLELGTSLGISTLYLASSSSNINCITAEGCPQIAKHAKKNFEKLNVQNIDLVEGNIDNTLIEILKRTPKLDLIFIDANHRQEAVLRYLDLCLPKIHNDSIIIIDDIHWSTDMESAWKKIVKYPQVTSTIDIFQMGIVFFNTNLNKKQYKVLY